jgi:hypothetical protein
MIRRYLTLSEIAAAIAVSPVWLRRGGFFFGIRYRCSKTWRSRPKRF